LQWSVFFGLLAASGKDNMKTSVCVCICVLLGLALPQAAWAGGKKGSGGGGKGGSKGAHAGGGGGNAGHAGGGGGFGGKGGGNGQGKFHGNGGQGNHMHGLNAHGHGNFQNNHMGKGWNNHNRFVAHNHFGNAHWRSGLRWRNSHLLYAGYHRAWHNRWWWRGHYNNVFLTGGGYWYWDGGYWFPAWGYDPAFTAYAYDGPIFSYANMPPDQVVVSVQEQLQDLGYYTGDVDGQLGSKTRDAIATYQRDKGLEVTSAVDEPTVQALGLNS
jgi:hypothetical protein